MLVLDSARAKARELRKLIGATNRDLLNRLREKLAQEYEIDLVPVDRRFLQDGRGEIVPAEGCLYYARDLEAKPEELLEVIAHEYGHLLLHHTDFGSAASDLIRGSVFLDSGASALSRYSPRSRAEAEASAFAAEFVCPAQALFAKWYSVPGITLADLASEYGATPHLIQQQLAEGLFAHIAASDIRDPKLDLIPTPEQERAATAMGFPVLVDAGPGTGKTRTLVRRIEFLIREKQMPPESVLVLTFSNEAANELQERIETSIGKDIASRIVATTFHGFGMVMLHALGHHIGLDADFSILDEICQEELLTDILGEVDCEALLDIRDPSQTAVDAVRNINYLKDRLIDPQKLSAAIDQWMPTEQDSEAVERAKALMRLYQRYEQVKTERNKVDFADLLALPQRILAEHEDVRREIRQEFSWVLVDEYQDVSRCTALFLQQLCGNDNPPWVVGDARQAIYRFRGAEPGNVTQFAQDFPGARIFELSENYRSSPEIVDIVNRLAALLENPEHVGPPPQRWYAAGKIEAFGTNLTGLAQASSDAAEREGLIRTVQEWLKQGIAPTQISVLARRNVDVRNIAIALKKNQIRAVTSGLLTAEGAGGDLAGVLSAVDVQQALPRVVFSLYRHHASSTVLNSVAEQLLAQSSDEERPSFLGPQQVQEIALEVWTLFQDLQRRVHSDDGWSVLCNFLFFQTRYIRDLIGRSGDADSAVQLEEVISALSLAAQYRFTHPHVQPRWSRMGLAERLRDLVTQAAPGLVPPRSTTDAVRVMTCHASKGLEFPCVAVAGQSLADIPPPKPCLPPLFRPNPVDDALQAESLLFVGVSRAKSSVMVSYATSASGTPRSRLRRFPALLTKLKESGAVPVMEWHSDVATSENITVSRVWGGERPSEISTYALGADVCRVKTYLEEQLDLRFRGRVRALYPDFFSRTRRILQAVIAQSVESGRRLSPAELDGLVAKEWPSDYQEKHPHINLYRPRARLWAQKLAESLDISKFQGAVDCEGPFDWQDSTGATHTIKLQLLAQVQDSTGDRIVVALQTKGQSGTAVNWSGLKDYQRLPFVLLHERHGDVHPFLFTGGDGQIRPFKWKQGKSSSEAISQQVSNARVAFDRLIEGSFDVVVDDWTCDRCVCRVLCPVWIGAAS